MLQEKLLKKISNFARSTFVPITEDMDGEYDSSKFSGIPWLSQNEEWPICPNCHKPLNFFMQLNLKDLPTMSHLAQLHDSEGLVQLFYCTNEDPHCESECEAFLPFSNSVVVRLVDIAGKKPQKIEESPVVGAFSPKRIVTWEKEKDYPDYQELAENNVELTEDEEDVYCELELTVFGDKLSGWPAWVQGVEYPNCPECGETMQILFQIDSEDHLPYMFGDVGCGHITVCPRHPHQLAFGWACS
ncbi:MAG: DUF1963 domain-containing protein [Candidatus Electrothrix sp. AU1_5]|nr:DUF1963 domain-containing protein [Candidatus Electrothrix gigas]